MNAMTKLSTMMALVYHGPGQKAFEAHAKPTITAPTDAIVKITKTTICGTDLHILKGDPRRTEDDAGLPRRQILA